MAYPDLPASPTFWRCPKCGSEGLFRANGVEQIECGQCARVATEQQLLAAHAEVHPTPPAASEPAP